jgi:hypothetical protein
MESDAESRGWALSAGTAHLARNGANRGGCFPFHRALFNIESSFILSQWQEIEVGFSDLNDIVMSLSR